jgi:hypothetical protein
MYVGGNRSPRRKPTLSERVALSITHMRKGFDQESNPRPQEVTAADVYLNQSRFNLDTVLPWRKSISFAGLSQWQSDVDLISLFWCHVWPLEWIIPVNLAVGEFSSERVKTKISNVAFTVRSLIISAKNTYTTSAAPISIDTFYYWAFMTKSLKYEA